ncbi:MAG: hypothetical protein JJE04_25125 [Acidobacteriia bacterium]|nr:hypothetical protein [Terriglobia bacterium]
MRPRALFLLSLVTCFGVEPNEDIPAQILKVRRIHVDRMAGGETANHIRDMVIGSLQRTGLFVITENPDKADAYLRGSAEDLVFTDTFQTSEGVNARLALGSGSAASSSRSGRSPSASLGVGENESSRIAERKHEAVASVRIVNKDGDVIWSTTKESAGAKFKGASADVADRITRQLVEDYELAKKKKTAESVR